MKILEGKTIFIIENDALNFAMIRTALRRAGATVPYDHWGDTTLTRMKEVSSELNMILLDFMLPDRASGYEIFEAVKSNIHLADIPVVVISAPDTDIEIPRAKEMGFDGFLSKPIVYDQLPNQLKQILEGNQIWGS